LPGRAEARHSGAIAGAGRSVQAVRAGGETFEVRGTLTEIASRLDPQQFLQISRSAFEI
jgi:DNA-binding LytR/AlgR family response regulator